ncbi:MAG: hypothetical protein U0326_34575 [Polyangiales bacterium]
MKEAKPTVSRTSLDVPASVWMHALVDLADFGEFDHVKPEPAPGSLVFSLGAAALTRGRARAHGTARRRAAPRGGPGAAVPRRRGGARHGPLGLA